MNKELDYDLVREILINQQDKIEELEKELEELKKNQNHKEEIWKKSSELKR